MALPRIASRLTVSLAVALLSACNVFETLDGCRDLAGTVNPALVEIKRLADATPADEADHEAIAVAYDRLAASLRARSFGFRLESIVHDYAELLEGVAKSTRGLANTESEKPIVKRAARNRTKQTIARQKVLNHQIEAICRLR
jgi:hypothetical protein